ncbi:inactive poly [ADP-ribose] polymerase RCD1 isoform X1 [Ziziphus jujuba]|uniref:Inactive poly [ADP-ribose] polymerase RCD1 isoform X1 n=2 Tax=Ziziphus jujuba TaxID=326968 RepID=A0A6P6GL82_ZIZJJ|nr:inactive poly [ADP-ribose] polymerase RCD1 isoform X1 [Ziziphus jujuba]
MEAKRAKALDNGQNMVINLKRKCPARCEAQIVGVNHKVLPQQSNLSSSFDKLDKHRFLDGCRTKCKSIPRRSLLKNYANFRRSGLPQRFLYHETGEWIDYPQEIVELIRKQYQSKNPALEVNFNGQWILLDILHMIQMELKTGLIKDIAWIDEAGHCFFPEVLTGDCGMHKCCMSELNNCANAESSGNCEIKLQLEIGIAGTNSFDLEECVGESNHHAKRAKNNPKPVSSNEDLEVNDHCNKRSGPTMQVTCEDIQKNNELISTNYEQTCGKLDYKMVEKMFVSGMLSSVEVIEIKCCSDHLMQTQMELFQKQFEITKKIRGNPNICLGWLAASKDSSSSFMIHGLDFGAPKIMSSYGSGVHLSSMNCAHISAKYCDDDEKGVRHMVLCRVILGSVEVVNPGSGQCCPSSGNFDCGVDDLQNPCCYIIWNMNINTHILPEYVVSFKTSSSFEGVKGEVSRIDECAIANLDGSTGKQKMDCLQVESGGSCEPVVDFEKGSQAVGLGSNSLKTPKSPWMPFARLFETISKEVAPEVMKLVNVHFDLFRSKEISRDDFIKKLRSIVGDKLLRSSIMSLQRKPCP